MRILGIILAFLLPYQEANITGNWYGPNGIIELRIHDEGHYEIYTIGNRTQDTGTWNLRGRELILSSDTLQFTNDTIFIKGHPFIRSMESWKGKFDENDLIGKFWTDYIHDGIQFKDTTTFKVNHEYISSSNGRTRNWKVESFQNRNYLYLEDIMERSKPLLIKKWTGDSLVVQYYDNNENNYHITRWKKIK